MPLNRKLNGYYDVDGQLPQYLRSRAEVLLAEQCERKKAINTKEKVLSYQQHIREQYIANIGGLPHVKTPLNITFTGEIDCGNFSIRMLYFESMPGYYVTANLYVPAGLSEPAPAVLFVSGHDEAAKSSQHYQYCCRDLANNGFVVLSVDPMSQGERFQNFHKEINRPIMNWFVEHTYFGYPIEWTGGSLIRYFLWDLVRALDVMETLPEADAARIGVTGNSGGGFQSSILMLHDPRVAAGMPVTFIKSVDDYMRTGQPQDGEMLWPRQLAMHMNDDDYLTAFAPKPAMIGAVESDFFCVEGVLECYESAKKMYALLGVEKNLELTLVPGTHNYNIALRQAAVRFFAKHLQGVNSNFIAQEQQDALEPSQLWATTTGQVAAAFANFKPIWKHTAENIPPVTEDNLLDRLNAVLKMPGQEKLNAPIHMRYLSQSNEMRSTESFWLPYERHEQFFLSEEGIALGALKYEVPGRTATRCALMVLEEGTLAADWERELVREYVTRGLDVFVMDPRGHGAARMRDVTGRDTYAMHGTEHKLACDADVCGLNLFGLRVFDILRGAKYLSQRYTELEFFGRGIGALWLTYAAPFVPLLKKLHREDAPPPYREMAATPYYRFDPRLKNVGILQAADTTDVIEFLQASGVEVTEFTRFDHNTTAKW